MDKIVARNKSAIRYRRPKNTDDIGNDGKNQINQLIEDAKIRGRTLAKFEWANITKSNSSLRKNASTKLLTKRSCAAKNLLIECQELSKSCDRIFSKRNATRVKRKINRIQGNNECERSLRKSIESLNYYKNDSCWDYCNDKSSQRFGKAINIKLTANTPSTNYPQPSVKESINKAFKLNFKMKNQHKNNNSILIKENPQINCYKNSMYMDNSNQNKPEQGNNIDYINFKITKNHSRNRTSNLRTSKTTFSRSRRRYMQRDANKVSIFKLNLEDALSSKMFA